MNNACLKKCNKELRKKLTEGDVCQIAVSDADGGSVRCVGTWAQKKIFYLLKYFELFTVGMKNKWSGNINYIEICSGPGKCIDRETGEEIDGTSLRILLSPSSKFLKKAVFIDNNPDVVKALKERIKKAGVKNAAVYHGDYNHAEDICKTILKEIDSNSLNLIFIDPTDCSVPFNLFKKLKEILPNADLIINIATHTDFNRNVKSSLLEQEQYQKVISKYSRFMGSADFFRDPENIILAEKGNTKQLRMNFRELFKGNLQRLGYNFFDAVNINGFYDIIFTSANPVGLKFWKEATKTDSFGQRSLF